ncbi:hypothetical protein BHM03_00028618 [Ensete ventricosum]|nr:hypothetical protein BHM03_00028618 [Ensete ventricosum]
MVDFAEMVSMSLMHHNPRVGGGCSGTASAPAPASTPAPPAESGSTYEVQEVPAKEAIRRPSGEEGRRVPEVPRKRQAEDSVGHKKKDRRKAQSLAEHLRVELDEVSRCHESVEVELEGTREELTSLQRQLADSRGELTELHRQLDDSESRLRSTLTQVREMETELLELTRSKDALWADLLKRVGEDNKKFPGFEMGLVRMGRVSLEYEYQLALARLRARHAGVEIELDPFASLLEDDDVSMADEQPFDDSLPPPEE